MIELPIKGSHKLAILKFMATVNIASSADISESVYALKSYSSGKVISTLLEMAESELIDMIGDKFAISRAAADSLGSKKYVGEIAPSRIANCFSKEMCHETGHMAGVRSALNGSR